MFTQEIDTQGQIITPLQKRQRVADVLRHRGFSRELANELAILAELVATMGDDLYRLLQTGALTLHGSLAAIETAVRQILLNTPTPLPRVTGASHLTGHEVFAKIAAKGYEGTDGVIIGVRRNPLTQQLEYIKVPIANHLDDLNCEARAHLGVIMMVQELNIPVGSLCKVWAFPDPNQKLLPLNEALTGLLGNGNHRYSFHVASAVRTNFGVLALDVPFHPSGPTVEIGWHRQL